MNKYTFEFNTSGSYIGKIEDTKEYGQYRVNMTKAEIIVKADYMEEAINKAYELVKIIVNPLKLEEVQQLNILEVKQVEQL